MSFPILVLFALPCVASAADSVKRADREPAVHSTHAPHALKTESAPSDDLDQALGDFKNAADRLGKSMAKAADEDTADARKKITRTMKGAILELSHAMDKASERFESARSKPAPKETP